LEAAQGADAEGLPEVQVPILEHAERRREVNTHRRMIGFAAVMLSGCAVLSGCRADVEGRDGRQEEIAALRAEVAALTARVEAVEGQGHAAQKMLAGIGQDINANADDIMALKKKVALMRAGIAQ